MKGDWTPERLMKMHGGHIVTVYERRDEDEETRSASLSEFLEEFMLLGEDREESREYSIRLRVSYSARPEKYSHRHQSTGLSPA